MPTILVQISDKLWTMQALHLACALARNQSAQLVLLKLINVRHPSYLGTSFGTMLPTSKELAALEDYAATAEDYGVPLTVQPMQCATTLNAVADAADQLEAAVVFAHVPKSWLPYWQEFQTWLLKRRLAAGQRQLFTLTNQPDEVPSITLQPLRMGK